MKILLRILAGILLLLVVALAFAFFSLNSLVKKAVDTLGPKVAKVEVHLGSADLSPFSGSGKLSKLFVGNPEGYKTPFALDIGSIKVRIKRKSLLSDPIVIHDIMIQSPQVTLEGPPFGNNLTKLLGNFQSTARSDKETPSETPSSHGQRSRKFIVQNLLISGAKLHVSVNAANQSFDQDLILPDIHLQNVGTAEGGLSASELAREILTPLLNTAIQSGTAPLIKQGLKSLQIQGADQINKVLGNFLKQGEKLKVKGGKVGR